MVDRLCFHWKTERGIKKILLEKVTLQLRFTEVKSRWYVRKFRYEIWDFNLRYFEVPSRFVLTGFLTVDEFVAWLAGPLCCDPYL